MKHLVNSCLFCLTIAAGCNAAFSKEADCSVARDPRRCSAQQAARKACNSLQGQARSACIQELMPPPDCSHAPNTIQCQARMAAAQACQDKRSKTHRQCLREKTKGIQ